MLFVTGANGFVGRALCTKALEAGISVRAAVRHGGTVPCGAIRVDIRENANETDWACAFAGSATVIHLAARAHVMKEQAGDPLAEFRSVNVGLSLTCAKAAAAAGVRRLVFVSSVGVHGAESKARPFNVGDEPAPHSAYTISKFEAELALGAVAKETGLELVVVRPPLVYGPNAPGNFGALLRYINMNIPLPLGAITKNRRSLIALDNLTDLLVTCAQHPNAANRTFLVSDGEDLSTTGLLRCLAQAMGKQARLLPVPPVILKLTAVALGKRHLAQSLLGSLQVDIHHTKEMLGWRPLISVEEGLRRAAAGSKSSHA